ncbi:Ankyrin repeat-containing domain protein [Metarhizium robertsii ARSEF 23]|nr:Ankyrin repeat-containing domain protein [Metarhizium robertsii ARSEF 23]EFY94395.2 Ankyrin repeat-containing domain protein [Metarhizium robertsii ARSEF 23]
MSLELPTTKRDCHVIRGYSQSNSPCAGSPQRETTPFILLTNDSYTVGWVCALAIELAAAQELLDEEHQTPQDSLDPTLYKLGRIGNHNVVLACLPSGQLGTHSAAIVAARMTSKFRSIRFCLMVGIGGGVPSPEADIRLGDVVISQPDQQYGGVVQYDFGKTVAGGQLVRMGSLNAPPAVLLNAVSEIRALHYRNLSNLATHLATFNRLERFSRSTAGRDVLFEAMYRHIGRATTCESCSREKEVERPPRMDQDVVIHYGTIASGNKVMKDGSTRDRLSAELGGVLSFEMEAAGLMNSFPCLVIRGISDYADSHKNKKWQPYAAATAAACAKEILSVIPAADVASTHTVNEAIKETMSTAINELDLDQFLLLLSGVDRDEQTSAMPLLDRDNPMFCWIFRNIDFKEWESGKCPQVLCLCGPAQCSISQVSSYILRRAKKSDCRVLHFFCSAATGRQPIVAVFVHTLLAQIVRYSTVGRGILTIRRFFHRLLLEAFQDGAVPHWKDRGFLEQDPPKSVKKILDVATSNELLTALKTALDDEAERDLLLVVDGLDKVKHQRGEFVSGVEEVMEYLLQRNSKAKILLSSEPLDEIKGLIDRVRCIEHDRERIECLESLRFNNTRYDKISEEQKGSFEWIWTHSEYRDWITQNTSRVLYIQGKPGSGKSTLTKYFNHNLLKLEPAAKSAIVARFFYSFREGELQRSHYNMLLSILYDILRQDVNFFYHQFQTEYRLQPRGGLRVNWAYASLKRVLRSLQDYLSTQRFYLIIDAVDESEESDRRDILKLLFELCSRVEYCVIKVFIASRPVAQLEARRGQFHNFIRLQDATRLDIFNFAYSLLDGLNLTHLLAQATEYIVKNAQGVFLWVKLIGEELVSFHEEGCSEKQVFDLLRELPTELEDFYEHMLKKMTRKNLLDGMKMLRFVLFARRPLAVDELLHALGIPDDPELYPKFTPSDDSFQKSVPSSELRILSCGGNFLEIKRHDENRIVQVMHQTVREFFLKNSGYIANSGFRMYEKDAHIGISITCIRYLMLCAVNTALVQRLPDVRFWTPIHFEKYTRYLNKRPLAVYALSYLKYHINKCKPNANIKRAISQLNRDLIDDPTAYLLESWAGAHLNHIPLINKRAVIAKDFRHRALHTAVRKGFCTTAEVLLAVGGDVDSTDLCGRTALLVAAENGHNAIVRLLLNYGANYELKDRIYSQTLLSWAAEKGNKAIVELLLDKGADVKSKDEYGRTPLLIATENGHNTIIELLLKNNADIECKDKANQTPLLIAAKNGHNAIVELLLKNGADIECKDRANRTPLFMAAENGHEAVVKLLLETGIIDVEARDNYGGTPL